MYSLMLESAKKLPNRLHQKIVTTAVLVSEKTISCPVALETIAAQHWLCYACRPL
jgi:hypothetical protein